MSHWKIKHAQIQKLPKNIAQHNKQYFTDDCFDNARSHLMYNEFLASISNKLQVVCLKNNNKQNLCSVAFIN